jgi:hypothetical protein
VTECCSWITRPEATVSTRRTGLIRADIQISLAAAFFWRKRSSEWVSRRSQYCLPYHSCIQNRQKGRSSIGGDRSARSWVGDDQTSLPEKWKPKSGYHSHFLDSRGANSLPTSHKFPILMPPRILFHSEASNPTGWGFSPCQKLVIIKKRAEWRQRRCEGWYSDTGPDCVLFAKLNFCVITFFYRAQASSDSPLSNAIHRTRQCNASRQNSEQRHTTCRAVMQGYLPPTLTLQN